MSLVVDVSSDRENDQHCNDEPEINDRRAWGCVALVREAVVASLQLTLAEEAIVVLLEELCFHLTHHIENHTDHDQKRGAAEEVKDE